MKTCSIEKCGGKNFAKGWCAKHYFRVRNHGSLTVFDDAQTQLDWLVSAISKPTSECITWPFSLNHKGYGRVAFGGRTRQANRVSLALSVGFCPPDREAAHTCDNRKCVNPDHLYWATPAQNKMDCIMRGTQSRKITAEQALFILGAATGTRQLADTLGITTQAVRNVRAGRSWGWLKEQSDVKRTK